MPSKARTHLSKVAQITVEPRDQAEQPAYKPNGFWYEVGGDWRRWCRSEGMTYWLKGHFVHRVKLGDERLLVISTAEGLDDFTDLYGAKRGPERDGIHWDLVAREWDGIEIAPYQWTRRFDHFWYYGWDCASGVIWRPRGITVTPPRKPN